MNASDIQLYLIEDIRRMLLRLLRMVTYETCVVFLVYSSWDDDCPANRIRS